jgi:hypothetical protein
MILVGRSSSKRFPPRDGSAAIKRSPIVLRLTERFLLARAWASVRKSPDVDAYVLAWIASHVRGGRPRSGCG